MHDTHMTSARIGVDVPLKHKIADFIQILLTILLYDVYSTTIRWIRLYEGINRIMDWRQLA